MKRHYTALLAASMAALVAACGGAGPGSVQRYDALSRAEFNRWAQRLNLPVYWVSDANHDGRVQPGEIAPLLFFPQGGPWVADGRFTSQFDSTYASMVAASRAAARGQPDGDERRRLVGEDLDQGRSTLVSTDLSRLPAGEREFSGHMLAIADLIDTLYERQTGASVLADRVPPADAASQSLFRRDFGPTCAGPRTEQDPRCSAIPGAPRQRVDVYPEALQADPKFCASLERRPDAAKLLDPFTVVREQGGKLRALPYGQVYQEQMGAIATHLDAAAAALDARQEAALVKYLKAAARSFASNDWLPADEAWAAMNATNSRWYVRVGPDEVYWEPCGRKAGFHLTFARINDGSLEWQRKLQPHQAAMEAALAERAGSPYKVRPVSFHLPDFIEIVVNAGDDRKPLGATVGQSLPNWGPVANQGRGRTVAMTNLYEDPDSIESRRAQAASVFDGSSMAGYPSGATPGLLDTILHEATHNLGPAHEYRVNGRTAPAIFGGPVASVLEELKAEAGAWYFVEFLRQQQLLDAAQAAQSYVYGLSWALGHISQGMYTGTGERKTYGNVAAILIGSMLDAGALSWDAAATAANGSDKGALIVHQDQLPAAIAEVMRVAAGIKARGDVAAAQALLARYVDGSTVVPHAVIAERLLREPKASFVYAVQR